MNRQAASPGCPDLETISAVFDGEFEPDESMRSHLGECPDCARRLADYSLMRASVMRAIASEPDEGLNSRIAAFVRAESAGMSAPAASRKGDFTNSRTAWILRIAALVMLSAFFVYLVVDEARENKAKNARRNVAVNAGEPAPAAKRQGSVMTAVPQPRSGGFVKAGLVPDSPSRQRQYRIDIDRALMPDDFIEMPADGSSVPLFASLPETDVPALQRIPLRVDPSADATGMLESIREDLNALDVPGLAISVETRENSVFTTIRLESAGTFDMSVKMTGDSFEFLMVGDDPDDDEDDDGLAAFQIEFFCE